MKIIVGSMVFLPREGDKVAGGLGRVAALREQLTVRKRSFEDDGDQEVRLYRENEHWFGVPRDWFRRSDWAKVLNMQGVEVIEGTSKGSPMFKKTTIEHTGQYAEQGEAVESIVNHFVSAGFPPGGILRAKPGFGKTNVAIAIACSLGVSTLIVVHKEFLMKQWADRIRKFVPCANIGIVQGGRCEFEGKDFVVAMVQSMALDYGYRYPSEFYSWAGFAIFDECHRVSAPTWNPIPSRLKSFYRLGLTATPKRGVSRVFFDHIGPIIFDAKTKMEKVSVRVKHVKPPLPSIAYEPRTKRRVVVSLICRDRKRDRVILDELVGALKSPSGRKIMVLSHRIEHLERLEEALRRRLKADGIEVPTIGHYTGQWPEPGMQERLVHGSWVMDEDGRKKAILSIYRSLSRRKRRSGNRFAASIEERTWIDPWTGSEMTGKAHILTKDDELAPGIWPRDLADGEEPCKDVILEELEDQQLFDVARVYGIRQDRKRKMRNLADEDYHEAERARVILATFQMCEEGLDICPIDTEILASPSGDVEQAIGRAQRFCKPVAIGGKATPDDCAHFCPWRAGVCQGKAPVILSDIVDDVEIGTIASAWSYRREYYRFEGFNVSGWGASGPRRLSTGRDPGSRAIQLAFRES